MMYVTSTTGVTDGNISVSGTGRGGSGTVGSAVIRLMCTLMV